MTGSDPEHSGIKSEPGPSTDQFEMKAKGLVYRQGNGCLVWFGRSSVLHHPSRFSESFWPDVESRFEPSKCDTGSPRHRTSDKAHESLFAALSSSLQTDLTDSDFNPVTKQWLQATSHRGAV